MSIRDGRNIANGTIISTEVCIVGTGPAGVTAAWFLQQAGIKVVLIDGGRDYGPDNFELSWPDKVKLYNGTADGLFASNERQFLILPYDQDQNGAWERERVYGGTSAHWGGQSRPLDPITFEARPGFPGWPITRAELEPYYVEAAKLCMLPSADFSAEYWAKVLNAKVPQIDGFDVEMYQFIAQPYRNFSSRTFGNPPMTIGQSTADVILNANLLDIAQSAGSVASLTVASMNDQAQKATQFTIKAGVYVLACGAVANAQRMLLSNVGNEYDQVGRYFMGHPISMGVNVCGYNFLTPDEKRLLDGGTVSGARPSGDWVSATGVTVQGRLSPTADKQRELGIGSCWFWSQCGVYYFELAPNPESRVTLADTVDPVFGQKQTRITWVLSDLDQKTFSETTQMFNAAVVQRRGTTYIPSWDSVKNALVVNGHHIGTTRMSSDPKQGVVDKNLKVHSLTNLYVAGSSVFASAGISNPTFTIITLSMRLAEHLIKVVRGRP